MKKLIVIFVLCGVLLGFNASFDSKQEVFLPEERTIARDKTGSSFDVGNFTYTILNDSTRLTVRVSTSLTNDEIPEKIEIPTTVSHNNNEYTVTEISKDGFNGLSNLKEVVFPLNLEKINEGAFSETGLEKVIINSSSFTTLALNSFYNCQSLTTVDFSNSSITVVNPLVFGKCDLLQYVNISNTKVAEIPSSAFTTFKNLVSINMSNTPITTIGNSAFTELTKLKDVKLPDSLITIDDSAFSGCTSIEELEIPNAVTTIGAYAFKDLKKITNITLPEGITSIGSYAFSGCTSLDYLFIPSTVKSIGTDAFAIPSNDNKTDKVIYIDAPYNNLMSEYMFDKLAAECVIVVKEEQYAAYKQNCSTANISFEFDLTIELNDYDLNTNKFDKEITITRLFNKPFNYVKNEETQIWSIDNNPNLITDTLPIGSELSRTNNGYEYRTNGYILDNGNNLDVNTLLTHETIIVPTFEAYYTTTFENNEYKIIGVSQYWTFNASTTIPNIYDDGINGEHPVKVIGSNAFVEKKITTLRISDGITTIEENAFLNSEINTLILSNVLETINDSAFKGSVITGVVTIPSTVTYIGNSAFENANLGYIYLNDTQNYGNDVFSNVKRAAGGSNPVIIAPTEEIYHNIENNINTEFFTHLVTIQLDYNGGVVSKNPVSLTRLCGFSIDYVQNNDLTWSTGQYTIPVPTKDGYKFIGWFNGKEELNYSTQFTVDVYYTAEYNILTIASDGSDGGINSQIYAAAGLDKNAILSITTTKTSNLNSLIPKKTDIYATFNIKLTLDGVDYKPDTNAFLVSIKLPTNIGTESEYTVYCIDDNGQLETIKAAVSHGYIVFAMTDIKDFALVNVPINHNVSTLLLVLILLFAIINAVQIIIILFLNKKKQGNIVTYSIAPLAVILAVKPNLIGGIIFLALVATAIFEFIYILYLFLTRNQNIYVNQLPEPSLEAFPPEATVSVEDLEDLLNQTHEEIDNITEDLTLEEYVDDEIEVFIDEEPTRQMMSLDDLSDEVIEDTDNDEDDGEEDEEVRTRLSETGQLITIRFKKSFSARLNLTEDVNKDYYGIIKNKLLSYRKVNSRISWHHEAFNFGRQQAAKINVRGKTLFLYLPLNPEDFDDTKYNFKDCSHIKKFEQLPFRVKIKSKRALQYTLELIELVMDNFETTERRKFELVNYYQKNRGFEKLLKEGLIKEVITSEVTEKITETITTISNNTSEPTVKGEEVIESKEVKEEIIKPSIISELELHEIPKREIDINNELDIVEEDEEVVDLNIDVDNEHKKKFIEQITETKTITTVISTPTQTVTTTQDLSIPKVEEVKEEELVYNPPIKLMPTATYE